MAELRNCPFCGTDRIEIMLRMPFHGQMISYYAQCTGCGARSALHVEKQFATEAWNRRYTPDEIDFDYGAEDE